MRELCPHMQGLYTPEFDHASCGVGFVADISGRKSHDIVRQGIEAIINLNHRGATGCDPRTGDGAGILIQVPDEFLRRECSLGTHIEGGRGFDLPPAGDYGVGMVFLSQIPTDRHYCEGLTEEIIEDEGLELLGWRKVPFDDSVIGEFAKDVLPRIKQVLVKRGPGIKSQDELERRLYVVRKRVQKTVREKLPRAFHYFYIPSFSTRTLVYKGMLICTQLEGFYPDLVDPAMKSALAMVHQRYSTNTFPTWDLSQPFRYLGHNGEINTLWGNINWMAARERQIASDRFGADIDKVLPVCRSMGSDSALLDNALEFLVLGGRSLAHSMMMLIPGAWEHHRQMDPQVRAFYEFHASLMEPWDGPAAVTFTDGRQIGAMLDRNGLRPSRYTVTRQGRVVLASETGVLPIPEEDIVQKGRLQPGKMFLVDTEQGRIVEDQKIRDELARQRPYRQWLQEKKIELSGLSSPPPVQQFNRFSLLEQQNVFGYTEEDLGMILAPMGRDGKEPLGSMGNDIPLAVLSDRPQLLYNYFKQRFAQVTNPPIDPIREEVVMSTNILVGGEGDLLQETPAQCHQIELPHPVLTNTELEQIRHYSVGHFRTITLPILYPVDEGGQALQAALDELCARASEAIRAGCSLLILSDRHVGAFRAPIPALLAVAALHQHLVREGTRTRVGIIVESGEPREVHHFCLLSGYGASAVNPYLALETVADLARQGVLGENLPAGQAQQNYIQSIRKGLMKVMSKMGISTLHSYHGAQIFEALGIGPELIDRYFTSTPSRIGGIGLDQIAGECRTRHRRAYLGQAAQTPALDIGGDYRWNRHGERHLINPDTIFKLQQAVCTGSFEAYLDYARQMNQKAQDHLTLRSLLDFKTGDREPVPLSEVEPAPQILKRFCTGAMSFGSISKEAHETLAIAMNRIGGRSNTGEGGEDANRFQPLPDGESKRSAVKQVASGRFGVTCEYCVNADELQIKVAQGAKPGEGGQLPGHKVNQTIAKTRFSTPGVGLISPPPHHDIYSIEDLAQLIYDLHTVNPRARVSVKLVAEAGVGTIAAGVAKGKADMVLISGASGGTGASPMSSIRHAGSPWELGLAETQQVLVDNDLRGRIRVQVDGKLTTGRDVAVAALLGAEEYGFATMPLIAMGCRMLRKCQLNTCVFGIATQDPDLRKNFAGRPEQVVNFFTFIAEDLRRIMASLGFRTLDEMIGRVDRLQQVKSSHFKARHLDLSRLLYKPRVPRSIATRCLQDQDPGLEDTLDHQLIRLSEKALGDCEPVHIWLPIRNVNRAVGTMLSGEIARRYGHRGLPDDTIRVSLAGSAGQSFGAWGARGLTLELTGEANDYLGKGLSGARIVVRPPQPAGYLPEENIIVGNVALYGAIEGKVFIRGRAGERFCVRNSGAQAVVEGVGDHACEYMTGGRVVILGDTGRNFAAGMSGGIAYVWDPEGHFSRYCNLGMVDLEHPDASDSELIRGLVKEHVQLTGSTLAQGVLRAAGSRFEHFVKVMPRDYASVLRQREKEKSHGPSHRLQEARPG